MYKQKSNRVNKNHDNMTQSAVKDFKINILMY